MDKMYVNQLNLIVQLAQLKNTVNIKKEKSMIGNNHTRFKKIVIVGFLYCIVYIPIIHFLFIIYQQIISIVTKVNIIYKKYKLLIYFVNIYLQNNKKKFLGVLCNQLEFYKTDSYYRSVYDNPSYQFSQQY